MFVVRLVGSLLIHTRCSQNAERMKGASNHFVLTLLISLVSRLFCVLPGLIFRNSTFCPHGCIYVLCGSENEQRLFPYTAVTDSFYNRDGECLLRGTC